MEKILVLHRYDIASASETNPAISKFLNLLSERYEVHFLSFRSDRAPDQSLAINVRIHEVHLELRRGSPSRKLVLSLLWILLCPIYCFILNKQHRFSLIYCDDSFPVYSAAIKFFVPKPATVMRLGDLQTGYIFDGSTAASRAIFSLIHYFEKLHWKYVANLIPISATFANYIYDNIGIKSPVVEEAVSFKDFQVKNRMNIRHRYNLSKEKTIFLFHGAIEKTKGIEALIQAVTQLQHLEEAIHFLIVGTGTDFKRIKQLSQHYDITNITFTGWVDYSLIPDFIDQADVGIVMRKRSLANDFVLTSALLQYAKLGKPTLAPRLHEIENFSLKSEQCFLFEPSNPESIANAIGVALKNGECQPHPNDLVIEKYNSNVIASKLSKAVEQFL